MFARIADLTADVEGSFTHEVGVIPTKDGRILDVYGDLASVYPRLTCLVDGDCAGRDYTAALAASQPPCPPIIAWPDDWSIESVVAWIVAADESVLTDAELVAAGLPRSAADLAKALEEKGPKTDEVLHALIADAISQHPRCCARIAHLLGTMAAIAAGRNVLSPAATERVHTNEITKIWKFNDAVSGI